MTNHPYPIFGTFKQTKNLNKETPYPKDIPFIQFFIENLSKKNPKYTTDYIKSIEFLVLNGRKSAQTFNAFRTEIERFILWAWLEKEKSITELSEEEINIYIDFSMSPAVSWVNTQIERHFVSNKHPKANTEFNLQGELPNKHWKPFRVAESNFSSRAKKIKRNPSKNSLNRQYSILSVFFSYLMKTEYINKNPMQLVKKYSPYLNTNTKSPVIRTFSKDDWQLILNITINKANMDKTWERNLFAIVTLKTLYLRISEIADRDIWTPKMNHFIEYKGYFWFEVFGKGKKERIVSVPKEYLLYLKRYRNYRGLSDFPSKDDNSPLIHKIKGQQGLSVRQCTRIIEETFKYVSSFLSNNDNTQKAQEISIASSHWLRHTGASIDIEDRPLKHISEDLGHADLRTTDRCYIQSTLVERAKSGKARKV